MIRGRQSPIVHVLAYVKEKGKDPQIAVTPDPLDMTQFPKGKHIITWQIDTRGYRFPTEGAAIEFTSPGWEESFSDFKVSECGRRVTAINKNIDGLAFAYTVHLVETATNRRFFLDPIIGNNMP